MEIAKSVEWIPSQSGRLVPGRLRILDQTLLPCTVRFVETTDSEVVWNAIKTLQVRGAPAIGVTAALGVAAAVQDMRSDTTNGLLGEAQRVADYLATSRPTAVNLFWALDRMVRTAKANLRLTPAEFKEAMVTEAVAIRDEDADMCRRIGRFGAELLEDGCTVLTHCNAGALATSEYGTALAPLYTAAANGLTIRAYADETRPLLQGSRLTAWELQQAGIDVTVICDNTAAQVMKEGRVDIVFVGADRIAANGDTANKIGTYSLAVAAKHHSVPFYVLAPTSTFDPQCATGREIPIEERDPEEITCGMGRRTAPEGVAVYAPAFDVTPADLIAGIVCEAGIARPDYRVSLATMLSQASD